MNTYIDLLRDEVKNGLGIDEAIEKLHANDFTITETMKFLISEYDLSLAQAKVKASENPVWNSVVESSRVMQDELVDALSKQS